MSADGLAGRLNSRDVIEAFAIKQAELERAQLPDSVGALLRDVAARFSSRPLWRTADDPRNEITYADFYRAARTCASGLAASGVGPGTHVAVMLPNRLEFPIAWAAVSLLGAIAVPLNTAYTARELRNILELGDVEFLIVDSSCASVVEAVASEAGTPGADRIVVVGEESRLPATTWADLMAKGDAGGPVSVDVSLDDPLSIQFTSGSTGTPKGCVLTHRYWVTIARSRAAHGCPATYVLGDMPFHYMGGQWRFLMAAYTGAVLVAAPRPTLNHFVDRLVSNKIEFCLVNNAMAKLPADTRYDQVRLRWAASSGLQKELQADFERRLRAPIREVYGTTETGATLHMPIDATEMVGSGSCGLPVAYRDCRIVDGQNRPVLPGDIGELQISGPGIFAGYYKRPADEGFAGKWFKTGDLACNDSDGFFYIRGRMKDVIRRNAENISASELEGVLYAMPEVLEAAAVPVPDASRGEEVKLYVVLARGLTPEDVPPGVIYRHCQANLAKFKLPRYLEYRAELPHTASDKIAKTDLLAQQVNLRDPSYDFEDSAWR